MNEEKMKELLPITMQLARLDEMIRLLSESKEVRVLVTHHDEDPEKCRAFSVAIDLKAGVEEVCKHTKTELEHEQARLRHLLIEAGIEPSTVAADAPTPVALH